VGKGPGVLPRTLSFSAPLGLRRSARYHRPSLPPSAGYSNLAGLAWGRLAHNLLKLLSGGSGIMRLRER